MTGVNRFRWSPELINLLRRRPELRGIGISAVADMVVC